MIVDANGSVIIDGVTFNLEKELLHPTGDSLTTAENICKAMLTFSKNSAQMLLMEIFLKYYTYKDAPIVNLLEMISRISYDEVSPAGQSIAIACMSCDIPEIIDKAIAAFENWERKDGARFLKHVDFQLKYLKDYADEVIRYLEKECD